MTFRDLAWRAEAVLARAALALLRALGPVGASNLGGLAARGIGPLLPVSRVAHANLARAMPELDAAARRRVVRGVWDNLGRTVAELPHVARLRPTTAGPGWVLEGAHVLSELIARDGPAILFSGHLANWEVLPRAAAEAGLRIGSFYRAAANPHVEALLVGLRRQAAGGAAPHFNKGAAGARAAVAHMRGGGRLAALVDQKMNDGIAAVLFGLPAMTASAMPALALRFGCPLVPARVERLGPARFRLTCEPPLERPATGERAADIAALTQAMNDRLEAWIRARPEQWLWLHRRWPPPE